MPLSVEIPQYITTAPCRFTLSRYELHGRNANANAHRLPGNSLSPDLGHEAFLESRLSIVLFPRFSRSSSPFIFLFSPPIFPSLFVSSAYFGRAAIYEKIFGRDPRSERAIIDQEQNENFHTRDNRRDKCKVCCKLS